LDFSWKNPSCNKVSCSRAGPTRLTLSFIWIHVWKHQSVTGEEQGGDGCFNKSRISPSLIRVAYLSRRGPYN
jgi:hypothetical protein